MPPRFLCLLIAAFALAACDTVPPRPTYPEIHFTGQPPFRLAVGAIDVRDDYKAPFQSPNVEHLFPVPPARAAETWAHDRLQAGGGTGRARFIIQNAAVIETPLKKKEGLTATFTKEASERYDATLQARLEIDDDHGVPRRSVTVTAVRSQTVLEGITPNERDQTWYDMTKALMADFDKQMSAEISSNFGGFFQ